jgi:hypothetical protein
MDKFSGSRRKSWQSKAPSWPFVALAVVVVAGLAWWTSGALRAEAFGDGTDSGSLNIWVTAIGALVLTSLVMAAAAGGLLNALILQPANRRHGLTYTAILAGVALLAGAPQTVARTIEADRAGYAVRLVEALQTSRQKQEWAYVAVHRELAFAAGRSSFSPSGLDRDGGFDDARKRLKLAGELVAAAPGKLADADAAARQVLAENIIDPEARGAVLARFDVGAKDKAPLLARYWEIQSELIALLGQHLDALEARRGSWEPMGGMFMFSERSLFHQFEARRQRALKLMDEGYGLEGDILAIDRRTNDAVDQVIIDEADGALIRRERRSPQRPGPLDRSARSS